MTFARDYNSGFNLNWSAERAAGGKGGRVPLCVWSPSLTFKSSRRGCE